jgi:serine/threonine protein kinase
MARPPGSSIGRYQIQDFIARGETTVVYQALEPESGAMVALKILPPSSARDPEQANRFLRQADALARLDHANLLSILDYGREEQVPFVAVSLAEGGALEARMASYREEAAALSLVASLASAIDYAHQNDVIHARIGPAHVLFDAQDAPLLTGLGRPYSAATGGRPPACKSRTFLRTGGQTPTNLARCCSSYCWATRPSPNLSSNPNQGSDPNLA